MWPAAVCSATIWVRSRIAKLVVAEHGVFAEFETNLRRERQAEGITAAKHRGVYRGRPPKIDMDAIKRLISKGLSPTEIARTLNVSRGTVYKAKALM